MTKRRKKNPRTDPSGGAPLFDRDAQLSLDDQARSLANILPQGEHARDQVENGLDQLMGDEPFWPFVDRPASPHLAHFAGFDVTENEFDEDEEP